MMKQLAIIFLTLILCVPAFAQKNKVVTIEINDKVKIDMVLIEPDTFIRKNYYGDTICHYCHICPVVAKNAYNGHDSIVLSPYYIAKFEVTRKLYSSVMHTDPSYFKQSPSNPYGGYKTTENCPVETVSWYDVQRFIDTLNKLTGQHFRLPTEAEWEYAGWGEHPELKYSGSDNANQVAWTWTASEGFTHDVGSKRPNGYGLYDISGNVSEWCSDWFASDYYVPDTLYNNPTGPAAGRLKVVKGGSWGNDDRFLEIKTRVGYNPNKKSNGIGFRLVMDAEPVKH